MITVRNIQKSFDGRMILKGFNADIEAGKITAVIGPSGGGKSTLLRAMSLLEPPDNGTITIDDQIYTFPRSPDEPLLAPWPKLTIVFQQLFLWPHLTIRRNITLPLERNGEVGGNGIVSDLIDMFEIGEFADRFPNQVSLGQRQRAALARALALRPKYLLLDEITSALDVEYVVVMLNHLKALRNEGTGIALVTHFIDFARRAADQVLFMAEGELVEAGSPEILDKPDSKRLARFLSILGTAR